MGDRLPTADLRTDLMPRYTTQPGNGGEWHIYPGGRRVFVRKQAPRASINPPPPRARPGAPRATPPPPPAPAVNPAPPDPTYDAQVGALSKAYESDVAGIG